VVGNDFRDAATDAITIAGATDLNVSFNRFEDLGAQGLRVSEVDSAFIDNNAMLHVGGTQMTIADSVRIDVNHNNIVIDNKTSQKGVRFERVTESRIADNFIDPGTAHMVSLSDSSDNLIEGNILDRGHAGVVLEGESARNMIVRNVIIASEYDGIYVSSSALDNTVVHNTIHNASSALVFGNDTVIEGNNLVTSDTDEGFIGYVNAAGYDFRLAAGSPHIDAGEELGYDCVPGSSEMYWDSAPDLGAVETHRN
jgi:parallel beta-helix repeat protein